MTGGTPVPSSTASDVVGSLGAAADVARQAYLAAMAANPSADLSALYKIEMQAAALWSQAEDAALNGDPAVAAAQKNLDAATANIRNQLATLKDITTWMNLLDNLMNLATTVGKFFV